MLETLNYRTIISSLDINTQLQVWGWLLNKYVSLGQVFTNPLRGDKHPGCFLQEYSGIVFLRDYGEPRFNKYTIIHAVADKMNCTLHQAAINVYAALYFNKPLQFNSITTVGQIQKGRKSDTKIHFNSYTHNGVPCFKKEHYDYWKIAGVKLEDLKEQEVYDIKSFYISDKLIVPKPPVFAYFNSRTSNTKIYSPFMPKGERFCGSTGVNDYWITNEGNNKLLITKSLKDVLVLKRLLPDWTLLTYNNEGVISKAFDTSFFETKVILYDNDKQGQNASKQLVEHIQGTSVFFDTSLPKDCYEIAVELGIDKLKNELNNLL